MKEFTGVQLQVIKALEKSIIADQAKLERVEESFKRQLTRLEERIDDLKGKTAADRELIKDSIDKSLEALKSFLGEESLDSVWRLLEMRREAEDFDEVFGIKEREKKEKSPLKEEIEEEELSDEPFKNIFK